MGARKAKPSSKPFQGKVVDQNGRPVAGARISFESHCSRNECEEHIATADADGVFQFPFEDREIEFGFPVAIEFPGGAAFTHLSHLITLPKMGQIAFRLSLPSGEPATNLVVYPTFASKGDFHFHPSQRLQKALSRKTNAEGVCVLGALPIGFHMSVECEEPGFAALENSFKQSLVREIAEVIELQLHPGSTVEGVIVAPNGKPMPELNVRAEATPMSKGGWGKGVTDENGRYRVDRLLGDRSYKILPSTGQSLTAKAQTVFVPSGETVSNVNFRLEKGQTLTGEFTLLETGEPATGLNIFLNSFGGGQNMNRHAQTGTNGRFEVQLMPGRYRMQVFGGPSTSIYSQDLEIEPGQPVHLTVSLHADLVARNYRAVRGKVIDAGGNPVEGAKIYVNGSFRSPHDDLVSDSQGAFVLKRTLSPSEGLAAFKGNWATREPVSPDSNGEAVLILRERVETGIKGTVFGGETPLAKAEIIVWIYCNGTGTSFAELTSDSEGLFSVEEVLPGETYGIFCSADGYEQFHGERFTLSDASHDSLAIRLKVADSFIAGTILDAEGSPVMGALISTIHNPKEVFTDREGRFHLGNVVPGQQILLVRTAEDSLGFRVEAGRDDLVVQMRSKDETIAKAPVKSTTVNLVGKPAPELDIAYWLGEGGGNLESFVGRVVLLDFWAIWCGPCKGILPDVERLHQKYAQKGLVVLGLHEGRVPVADIESFMEEHPISYAVGVDQAPEGPGWGPTFAKYGVHGIPSLVVIDREGRVASMSNDLHSASDVIVALLAQNH